MATQRDKLNFKINFQSRVTMKNILSKITPNISNSTNKWCKRWKIIFKFPIVVKRREITTI